MKTSVISSLTQHPSLSFALFSYSVRVWNIEKSRKNSGKIVRIRKPRRLRGSERISEKPCAPVTQTRVKKDDTGRKVGRRRSKGGALMAHRRGEASVMDSNYYLFDLFFTHPSKREIFPFRDVFWSFYLFNFSPFHDYLYRFLETQLSKKM